MAKIKNLGDDCTVPWLGGRLVLGGQVVEVPDAEVWAYTQQERWEPADKKTQALHDAAYAFHNPEPLDLSAAGPQEVDA